MNAHYLLIFSLFLSLAFSFESFEASSSDRQRFYTFEQALQKSKFFAPSRFKERKDLVSTTVSFDDRAILLNGTRKLLLSGSVHYSRSTPSMWYDILKRSKDAGINVIQTYVFWNLHQPEPGFFYFEENANIFKFLQIAWSLDLYVTLRIGPYACAEWNYGGFPEWLKEVPGIEFRTYNQPFMDQMALFMTQIIELIEPYLARNGGPIILAQVENEYGSIQKYYGENGTKYAKWAADFANGFNIGIPWIMCWQDDRPEVIDTCNGYYCDPWLAGHWNVFPEQPALWTENQRGSCCDTWGNSVPTRPPENQAYGIAIWFAKGGAHNNFYMWHGGTNFDRWSSLWITTYYQNNAPLDEYGLPTQPNYDHFTRLHRILSKYERPLLLNDPPTPTKLGPNQFAYVYGDLSSVSSIVFLCNNDHSTSVDVPFNGKTYHLPAWSVTILGGEGDLFNTAVVNQSIGTHFSHQPRKLKTLNQAAKDIQFWKEVRGIWDEKTAVKASHPLEQLSLSHDWTDYLWYVTELSLTNGGSSKELSSLVSQVLLVQNVNDYLHVFVDDDYIGSSRGGSSVKMQFSNSLGKHTLAILCMTMGLDKGGVHQENYNRGILGKVSINSKDITNNGNWLMQPGLLGLTLKIYTITGQTMVNWTRFRNDNIGNHTALTWYSLRFENPKKLGKFPVSLDLSGMGKGFAWVNGNPIGRYWNIVSNGVCSFCNYSDAYDASKCQVNCGRPTQRYYHVPSDFLNENDNESLVVLLEEEGGDPSTVKMIERVGGVICDHSQDRNTSATYEPQVFLRCDPGTYITSIDFASFGTPIIGNTCENYQEGSCHAENSKEKVQHLCPLGSSMCRVPASISFFGDPCPSVQNKFLAILISCK